MTINTLGKDLVAKQQSCDVTKCRDFPNHVCNKVKKGQCETMDKETFKTSQMTDSQCHFSPILNARIYQCVEVIHLIVLLFWILVPYFHLTIPSLD